MWIGLDFAGLQGHQNYSSALNEERFWLFYRVGLVALFAIYSDIFELENCKTMDFATFLMAMNCLKLYKCKHVMSVFGSFLFCESNQ